mgnify:CR=1 FL=1
MAVKSDRHAPIALFVFKRPEHTARMLAGLLSNPEFAESPLFIFSDGARNVVEQFAVDAVRTLIADFSHTNKTIVYAPVNQGLADSIIQGVTQLCAQFGRVIVVEDDLVVSPFFLNYMNTALARYENVSQVMQISGHMFPVKLAVETDAIFLPFTTSWGWATWQRAWQHMKIEPEVATERLKSRAWRHKFDIGGCYPYSRMLAERLAGKNNSWAIWWYFQVFARKGLTLFPRVSLVNNEGFDGSGTHCDTQDIEMVQFSVTAPVKYPEVMDNAIALKTLRYFLRKNRGFVKACYDQLWRIFAKNI